MSPLFSISRVLLGYCIYVSSFPKKVFPRTVYLFDVSCFQRLKFLIINKCCSKTTLVILPKGKTSPFSSNQVPVTIFLLPLPLPPTPPPQLLFSTYGLGPGCACRMLKSSSPTLSSKRGVDGNFPRPYTMSVTQAMNKDQDL